jgi:hypothetical protein
MAEWIGWRKPFTILDTLGAEGDETRPSVEVSVEGEELKAKLRAITDCRCRVPSQ